MYPKKMSKITLISLALFLLQNNPAVGLYNEGLPGSYGQSDIEAAKVPDSTQRPYQSYYGGAKIAPRTSGNITSTKPGNPLNTRTIGVGTNPTEPFAPTPGSPSSSSNTIPYEDVIPDTPLPTTTVTNPTVTQINYMDDSISEDLHYRIANDTSLYSTSVTIMTQNGIVTLTGTVDTLGQKQRIESFARSVPGVKTLESKIVVIGADVTPYNDTTTGNSNYDPSLTPPGPSP